MSQTIIRSLKSQNAVLQGELESFAHAIDSLSQQFANALNRLRLYDPEFVLAMVDPGATEAEPDRRELVVDGAISADNFNSERTN